MKSYDLHVHSAFSSGTSSIEQIAETAKELGYRGFCFSAYYKNLDQIKKLYSEIEKAKEKVDIEIFLGFEARNEKEIDKLRMIRSKFDVLLVHGGDLKLNRKAVETPEVDILTHPEFDRSDSGMNDVLFRLARKNEVAIEINFREVLNVSRGTRARVMKNICDNVKLARKLKASIIVCSGAVSYFELKDPVVLSSFVNCLGVDLGDAKDCISKVPEGILKEGKKKRSRNWVMPGVKVVGRDNE